MLSFKYSINMNFQKLPLNLPIFLYDWLKDHAEKLGESMNAIVKKAVTEYREKHERKN